MNKATKLKKRKSQTRRVSPVKVVPGLLILAYMLIPTYTPNLMAFDTNAPKFLALAIVNMVAFIYLLSEKQTRQQPGTLTWFFKTAVGFAYSAFMAVCLLSLFNAINLGESVLQLAKVFSVFMAVYVVSEILMRELQYLKWIVIIFTGMLVFDSLSVFYHINEFIQGRIETIKDIKTIYSNKNILASAIYVKLPFALWLMMFRKGWLRMFGWIALLLGVTGIFFMATRAFYLGLIILSFAFLLYVLYGYLRSKEKTRLWPVAHYLLILAIAYIAFTFTEEFLYPKSANSRYTEGIGKQLTTINTIDNSARQRLTSWKWSWDLIKEKPLLGVGSGNWKVDVLKFENRLKADYEYLFKAHNDFIETAAETGLIGGLLYLSLFVMTIWAFLRKVFSRQREEDDFYRYLFLAATGMAFYAVDAFFNFPADRPEILVLFTFYLSAGIAATLLQKPESTLAADEENLKAGKSMTIWAFAGVGLFIVISSAYILYLNFESSKLQRTAYQEVKSGRLVSPSELFLSGFPVIPNLNIMGEPIDVIKARFLLNENKNEEAIAILRAEHASPWDGRREYFMAMGFNNLGETDSALAYSEKLRQIKPNHVKNILIACQKLEAREEYEKVSDYIETYLEDNKKSEQAWVYAASFYNRIGNVDRAWELIEEGKKFMPRDSLVEQQYKFIYQRKFVDSYIEEYTMAREQMNKKNYASALEHINLFIEKVQDYFPAHQVRAYIYYYQGNYRDCIREIDYAVTLSDDTDLLVNLRGVCHYTLKEMDAACKDFETAMQMGNKDGRTNYDRFCREK